MEVLVGRLLRRYLTVSRPPTSEPHIEIPTTALLSDAGLAWKDIPTPYDTITIEEVTTHNDSFVSSQPCVEIHKNKEGLEIYLAQTNGDGVSTMYIVERDKPDNILPRYTSQSKQSGPISLKPNQVGIFYFQVPQPGLGTELHLEISDQGIRRYAVSAPLLEEITGQNTYRRQTSVKLSTR